MAAVAMAGLPPAETNQTRQQGNLDGYRKDCFISNRGLLLRGGYGIY